jgi:putative transposase
MAWKPKHLTREQLEERRLLGGRWLQAGKLSQAEIARRLGVSRTTVSDWAKQLVKGDLRQLQRRKSSGRPPKLTTVQAQRLLQQLKHGARAAGFATERWTLPRIQKVIEREYHLSYHPNYLGRLLARLGWSPQVPLPQAVERDEDWIVAWLEQDWPRIKKGAANRRRNRVF